MSKSARRLGRGLDALLPQGPRPTEEHRQADEPRAALDADEAQEVTSTRLPVDAVRPNPRQPRKDFDEDRLEELAGSIREHGLLQPIVVRRAAGGYELVTGERRLRACRLAGLDRVPATVASVTDQGMLEAALVENLQREDLNPMEVAHAYRALVEDLGLTHEQAAQRIGVSRVAVTNMLRLLALPPEVRELVGRGALAAGHARALLSLAGAERQVNLARRIAAQGLSVRQAEHLVRRELHPPRRREPRTRAAAPAAVVQDYEARLRERLGTKVRIQDRGGRGEIVIEYYSTADFARILEALGLEES